ncbi:MAG TPA: alpha/beta hydrolase [Anaerolineales bacterium]|nr:alpha/beta hydrolase [Anaerolineales bacterium]
MKTVISKDGTRIAYDVYGAGPAIVLVDGATATRAFGGSTELAQRLAKAGFTTYVFDRRTRGESSDTQPYAVAREIEDIEALIDQAGGTANLYGISSGGALALEAAAVLGDKVKKLAVYEVPYLGVDPARVPAREIFTNTRQLVREGKNGEAFAEYMGKVAGLPEQMLAGMKQAPFWPMMEAVAPSLVNDATIMFGRDFTPQKELLEKITMPVLALSGDVDMLPGVDTSFMAKAAKAIASMVPHGTYKLLSGQSHDVKAEVISPVLSEFYAS